MKHLKKFNENTVPNDNEGNPLNISINVPSAFVDIATEAGLSLSELKSYLEEYLTNVIFSDDKYNLEEFRNAMGESDFRGEYGDEGMVTYPTK